MLYFKNSGAGERKKYVLNFNGTNQRLQGTFTQFERTNSFTLFSSFQNNNLDTTQNKSIYSTRRETPAIPAGRGLLVSTTGTNIRIDMVSDFNGNIRATVRFIVNTQGEKVVQITYDGSSNPNNIKCYVDDVEITSKVIEFNNLTNTIVNTENIVRIGFDLPSFQAGANPYWNGFFRHTSIINYVKNRTERTADFAAGKQSVGTGSWLLQPIEPIYRGQITSLNSTIPLASTLPLSLINYPNPLILGTNLIEI